MAPDDRTLDRLQWLGTAAVVALSIGVLVRLVFFSADVAFLTGSGPGPWITAPRPVDAQAVFQRPESPPRTTFVRRFGVDSPPARATIAARGLRSLEVELNGYTLAPIDPVDDGWRSVRRFDATRRLHAGRNELRLTVTNPNGPALLQAIVDLGGEAIPTDEQWTVLQPGVHSEPAALADDTRRHPQAAAEPGFLATARREAMPFAAALVLALAAGFATTRLRAGASKDGVERHPTPRVVVTTLVVAHGYWLALLFFEFARLPVMMGFDAPAHMVYLDHLLAGRGLPTAADGFSSYHPPLFHAATAALVALFDVERESLAGRLVYRTFTFAPGLLSIWCTHWVAARVWPGRASPRVLAIAGAALLPMSVYTSAYVSNEALHAGLVSLALYLAGRAVHGEARRPGELLALALALGAAMLVKFTALLVAPILAFFVGQSRFSVAGERPGRAAFETITILAGAFVVAGWFYVRNWLRFGDPLVWNLDVPGMATWWLQPGFHTPAYYLSFGEVLRHSFFAGFVSFFDGVYSTFWGDGLVAGMVQIATRHGRWNDAAMTLVYGVSLPASALSLYGAGRLLHQAFSDPSRERRTVLAMSIALLYALLFSLLAITLRLPFYAQAKAPYVLAAIVPFCLSFAEGTSALDERLSRLRQPLFQWVLRGYLLALAVLLAWSFLG